MLTFLILLFLIVCFLLILSVLLQAGRGGGLAAGFGGSGTGFELLGGRQTATFLHQSTRVLGGAFLSLAFLIAVLTARQNRPASLIEREFEGEPEALDQQVGTPEDLETVVNPPAPGAQPSAPAGAEPQSPAAPPAKAGTPPPAGALPAPAGPPGAPGAERGSAAPAAPVGEAGGTAPSPAAPGGAKSPR